MKKYNEGIVFTNDNCIGCNKCISNCSTFGANVSVVKDGKNFIKINSKKCSSCGDCLTNCIHGARDFKDDMQAFIEELQKGEKYSVILDPSFFIFFGETSNHVLGYLKSLGVEKIYDGVYGAEINIWSIVNYLKKNENAPIWQRRFLSANCTSFVNNVEMYHPELYKHLIPVYSPMICTAIYARNYLKDENKFAFLGSCISKKIEMENHSEVVSISMNLTYKHLQAYISDKDISSYSVKCDLEPLGFGRLTAFGKGLESLVSNFFDKSKLILSYNGMEYENLEIVRRMRKLDEESKFPLFIEFTSSKNNCISCNGIAVDANKPIDIYKRFCDLRSSANIGFENIYTPEDYFKRINEIFCNLNLDDFTNRKFEDKYHQPFHIPDSTYNEVFNVMLKNTEEKQNINCGSCGYSSCKEMAKAIAYGYNKKENCIHYMNDLMKKRLTYDNETGILGRYAFIRQASEMIYMHPGTPFIVFVGDVNRMKVINDVYSFPTGTAALKIISKTLTDVAGEKGLCGRLGGGSFAICFEYNPENMQRFRAIKSFDCTSLKINIPVTMRFGAYIVQNETVEDFTVILNWATLSMDKKISETKNTITMFTQEYRERMFKEARIAALLQPALDNKEFTLWFQPQYHAASGELIGAEALCRWIKPDGTIIPPDLFIPISEKNGFIRVLDQEIWRMAFERVHNWLEAGIKPVPISVNISRISLQSDELINVIRHLDEVYQVPVNLIHFEITESAYMGEVNLLIDRISKIRDMGFKIAMDDFGSGYSSLNTLKDLPIDILKLDMGFLRHQTNMNKGGTIISSIIRMAQDLELNTIAEGVETVDQASFLNRVGCDIIQGYIYAKQMPEEKFKELLSADRRVTDIVKPRILGKIDTLNFYDPSSIEYMMFEEFTGPAALIEYDDIRKVAELVRCNSEGLKLFGIEKYLFSEVKDLFNKFVAKTYNQKMALALEYVVQGQENVTCVVEGVNYNTDSPIWIKLHIRELSVNNHQHIFHLLLDDITDEKISESTLSISNSQMSMVLDNSQIGLCLMNVHVDLMHFKESVKLRIVRCNQQFLDMTGFTEEEVLNWTEKDAFGVIHPLDRPLFIAKSLKEFMRKEKKAYSIVYRAKRKDKSYCKVKAMVSGVQQQDKSYLLVTNFIIMDEKITSEEE